MPELFTRQPSRPDAVLVHECPMAISKDRSARGLAGLAPLIACGHTHRYAQGDDETTIVLHTGTVGAGGLDAFSAGGLQDFDAQLMLFNALSHQLVRYYDVAGEGGAAARFTRHDIEVPVAAPLLRGGF